MKFYSFILPLVVSIIFLSACTSEEDSYIPKPYGYFRIELPEQSYQKLEGDYPYSFEHSKYAKVVKNTSQNAEENWITLKYEPTSVAEIHITYKEVKNDPKLFMEYVNDAHKLTFNEINTARSSAIDKVLDSKNGNGIVFTISEGEVPTVFNYWISDTTTHFFRAAMYVPTSNQNDSLAPILKYTKEDMMHMLETFEWK
ncbi:gliding motility lipoprotein GldD [Bernardetia sp.]|uniref:gliding motility lipoprotein GldD n=1 Tax=Bernardetia sp. TaxID=1937974 RepID=UPI0025C00413|nr:gliding motility lipoprotein GldD [Bernardetia sp.]